MHEAYQWNISRDGIPSIPGLSPSSNNYVQRTQQERKVYDAESLAEAAGAISASLDLPLTLEKVVEHTAHLLHVEKVGVYLFDEHDDIASLHLSSRKSASNGSSGPSEPSVSSVSSALLASLLKKARAVSLIRERGEPVIIDDAHASPLLPPAFIAQMDIGSIALLPLVTARGVIGFITVSRPNAYHWLVDDIRLGLALATQSATAIENARLFATLQQHNRHIEALNTVAQTLSTLPNLSQHLDSVLRRITEIMHLETGIILLLDVSKDRLVLASHCGLPPGVSLDLASHPLKTLHPLIYGVIASGEPFSLCVARHADEMVCESLRHIGFSNVMAVPLTTSGTVLGVLVVGNNSSEDFADDDLKLFSTIGQQLGLALKNAQLLRSTSEMEALREADRLKSSFLAAVSHDLRSPLTAIRASIESLLDADGIQSAQIQEHLLYNIAGQTNRLDQLVEQLLDLSRIEAGALALDCDWTELPALITDTATKFERLHTHCSIECVFADHLPLQYIDPSRLAQVLWNLLENAHKYADPCSPTRIETHIVGNEVHISVADRCAGIPKEEHERIFQRFYRLNKDRQSHTKGTGLGLSICRGIVEAHSGRMWVEDRAGGGCVFIIALPLPTADLTGFDTSEELFTHPANDASSALLIRSETRLIASSATHSSDRAEASSAS
jgi:signal transduction histidine kinase